MASIEINNRYDELVNGYVQPHFAERGIEMTYRAKQLFAFAMQSQVEEKEMSEVHLAAVVQMLVSNNLAEYYLSRYGNPLLSFNRAFHLLAEVGPFAKFPFGPSRPFAR